METLVSPNYLISNLSVPGSVGPSSVVVQLPAALDFIILDRSGEPSYLLEGFPLRDEQGSGWQKLKRPHIT